MFISVFLFVKYQRPILQCVSHWVARPLPPLPFFHFSLSEGGCHSPAFLFQRVNQLNLQDETQICCIFLFLSQYTLLSLSEGGCHSPAFPFQRVNQLNLQEIHKYIFKSFCWLPLSCFPLFKSDNQLYLQLYKR